MVRLRVCLLWHMHQPMYRDPGSGEFILPWVRLHSTRAYYDMAKVLSEFEGARAVVNMVPSLLWQLDQYVKGQAKDRFLELTRRPADELSLSERQFVLKNFFMVDWETCIRPLPRYWELLHGRGLDLRSVDLAAIAAKASVQEMRDLQVLFNLAWMGFRAEEDLPEVAALRHKGREFTEDDKAALLGAQQTLMSRIMPAYAEVARSGQAELTVTPFYHPILPLLVDSNSARRAMPQATLPPRFSFPEDAQAQVRMALDFAEQNLGTRPRGMWPSEGSVSPEVAAILAGEGVRWAATDEQVLLNSKPHRDRRDGALHRPYRVRAFGRELSMVFRDHGLSDLIGFTYAKASAKNAVDDLFKHLDAIARSAPKGEVPLVTIALDGENAWEHYQGSGREFLRLLYKRLAAREGGFEPVLAGQYLEQNPPKAEIAELHTGSWIDCNFRIWIGHPEDNLGWTLLREAREAVAQREKAISEGKAGPEAAEQVQKAKQSLYAAEGSDWFWWYGDDFSTDSIEEFDALFRSYVKEAWKALGEVPPTRLDSPISRKAGARVSAPVQPPQGFIRPKLDGRVRSYFEWTGAGHYKPDQVNGAMFRGQGIFDGLHFGFDERTLYLRLDPTESALDSAQQAHTLRIELLAPRDRRLEIRLPLEKGQPALEMVEKEKRQQVGQAAFHDIVELGLPFEALELSAGMRLGLAVMVDRDGVEVERLPRSGHVVFAVPDQDYERKNWKV